MIKNILYSYLFTILILINLTPFAICIESGGGVFTVQSIYIREDSSIHPSSASIERVNDTYYVLTSSIYSAESFGIVIEKNNIVLEPLIGNVFINNTVNYKLLLYPENTFSFENVSEYGRVIVLNVKYLKIHELRIEKTLFTVYLYNVTESSISNNEFTSNYIGLYLAGFSNYIVVNNIFISNYIDIWVMNTCRNTFFLNVFQREYVYMFHNYPNSLDNGSVSNYWYSHVLTSFE